MPPGINLNIGVIYIEICGMWDKPKSLIRFVKDRPRHGFRYSLNCEKIKKLGEIPRYNFEDAFKETIEWYRDNEWWWRALICLQKLYIV